MMTTKKERGQDALMTQAHRSYAKGMVLYSFLKTHNQATSDDLVQDAFVKTWRYLVKGGDIVIMKAFLYHTLNHLIIDGYRKHKTTSLEVLMEKGYEPSIDNSKQMFDIFDGKAAVLLIQHLPLKYREIVEMRYVRDLSLKEISLITGQTRNAVAVQAHRGLTRLKELYRHKTTAAAIKTSA